MNHRVGVTNPDGTHSSIFSMTVPVSKDGHSVSWNDPHFKQKVTGYALVPSLKPDGKFMTPNGKMPPNAEHPKTQAEKDAVSRLEDAATDYYNKTRQHLGIFKTEDAADAYATKTHAYTPDGTSRQVFTPSY